MHKTKPEITLTTLGYIEQGQTWLMLNRNRKEKDLNKGKFIGIGGKVEPEETILEAMVRECREETGLDWLDPTLQGIITFNLQKEGKCYCEQMFLFSGSHISGILQDCTEGELVWIEKDQVDHLPLWKGDRIFFALLNQKAPFFFLRLDYIEEDLVFASLQGKELLLEQDFSLPFANWLYRC